ncbi:anti-sigma factor family protein [Nakamurella lactea]|uniref:anti-sigma factor family protein n=1 Tax=Nakamurella lactea TaxID=459515 RepID=UPI00041EB7E8|nr:zf-HC2 domain-containing protein [Nakamurella lactea]
MTTEHLSCQVVVELLTDYLDGALDADTVAALEAHLATCPACVLYLEQLRTVIESAGRLPPDTLSEAALAELEAAFRGYRPPATQ